MRYGALQNSMRLEAFLLISEKPGVPFSEIAKKFKEDKALVAYHLGVLKAVGLVNFTYERKGRNTSKYDLTDIGRKTARELAEAVA